MKGARYPVSDYTYKIVDLLHDAKKNKTPVSGWVLLPDMDSTLGTDWFFQCDFRNLVNGNNSLFPFATDLFIFEDVESHRHMPRPQPDAPILPLTKLLMKRVIAIKVDSSSWYAYFSPNRMFRPPLSMKLAGGLSMETGLTHILGKPPPPNPPEHISNLTPRRNSPLFLLKKVCGAFVATKLWWRKQKRREKIWRIARREKKMRGGG